METLTIDPRILRVVLTMSLLTLPIKGYAIWKASRNSQKGWFVALYLFNTLGLLELVYLFYFSKSKDNN